MSPLLFTSKRMSANISHYKPPPILTFGKGSIYYYMGPKRPKKTEHASSTAQVLGNPSPMPKRFPEDILRNVLRAKPKRHLEGWWSIVRFPLTFGLPKVRRGPCLVEYDHSIHNQSFPRECSIQPFPVNYDRIYKKYQQLVHNRCARCNLCNA